GFAIGIERLMLGLQYNNFWQNIDYKSLDVCVLSVDYSNCSVFLEFSFVDSLCLELWALVIVGLCFLHLFVQCKLSLLAISFNLYSMFNTHVSREGYHCFTPFIYTLSA
ncbi:MAG: hypothetical protein Q8838_02600, partial [Candidatus Phytoplasma australasiaticum]|nr:hypothetical protein [Candidatus Phytoplasma australasiaticum]